MVAKRKHNAFEQGQQGDVVAKPPAGTKTFTSGQAVRDALAGGSRQAYIAFHQQILTPYSALPLALNHPSIVILQHYHSLSPNFDEIFNVWKEGDRTKNEQTVEATAALLAHIVQTLTPIPYFRTAVLGIVGRIIASNEQFGDMLNRLIQSPKRDQALIGLQLAAACINVDPPDAAAGPSASSGRLAVKVWSVLVDGGSAKMLGKVLGMRRRNKEGTVGYGSKDPLDRPDIRHAALHLIIPLLSLQALQAHSRTLLLGIYNHVSGDPPITIYRLLNGLWSAITGPSSGIARRTALALMDENALENLLGLLNRLDVESTSGKSVGDMTMAFLEATTTIPGRGICFPDEGWYPRRSKDVDETTAQEDTVEVYGRAAEGKMRKGLHNRILSNVIRKLGSKVVDDQGRIGDWAIKVLHACPELVAGYWPYSALALDPKLNARWLATVSYVGRIISLPPPPMSTFHEPLPRGSDITDMPPRSHPPSVAVMVESIFPAPLGKIHLSKGLQHSDHLVQHVTALALARGLQKLDVVQGILREMERTVGLEPGTSENPWAKRQLELELECRRRVPEVLVVIAFAQKSATLAKVIDDNDEPDPKLVAKSAMLTEVALRLFGLYHKTLPTVSREAKFDVGKLLVSASSAKAERREKREAREGSVISDTGSVGSIGTLGTVGMGGGFGQGRGDVDGFDAMSQVHVLSLLTEVKEFQWTNKAAGSQYSYLYHILILHLSTPHPITKHMTTSLLRRVLLNSIMFEHDHGELDIWLAALPTLSSASDMSQRVFLIAQQIHLLSFLDECVRRCMKTPYRYLEDVTTLVPDYFQPNIRPFELVSPLLMTILEQLRAKIMGQLIATEAAGVVLTYLRRVILGLSGKVKDDKWLSVMVNRLEVSVTEAREKGQERKGLLGSVQAIRGVLREVFGGDNVMGTENAAVEMVDEDAWSQTSFETILLNDPKDTRLSSFLVKASRVSIQRYGRLAAHLFASKSHEGYLVLLHDCLTKSSGKPAQELREAVFAIPAINKALLPGSIVDLGIVETVVACLRPGLDEALASEYVQELLESMQEDKKGKKLNEILPFVQVWSRFFTPSDAQQAVGMIAKNIKRVIASSDKVKQAISSLIVGTKDPRFALARVDQFVAIGIIEPFSALLQTAYTDKDHSVLDAIALGSTAAQALLVNGSGDACKLLQTMVESSPAACKVVAAAVDDGELLKNPESLPLVAAILDIPDALPSMAKHHVIKTAIDGLSHSGTDSAISSAARRILVQLVGELPEQVDSVIGTVDLAFFSVEHARLANDLAPIPIPNNSLAHLVNVGLQRVTRFCSDDAKLDERQLAMIEQLASAISRASRLDVDANFAEPLITSVIQERLDVPVAVSFASLLVEKSMLKASFIRQHISLLLSSTAYRQLASPIGNPLPAVREGFVQLLSAMFSANPYISCQPVTIEQLLPLYKGTLAMSDQRLLSLFQLFESYRHISVASVLSAWSSGPGRSGQPFDAVTTLDPGKMFATAIGFPLRRPLRSVQSVTEVEDSTAMYDPAFVLSLFAAMLATDINGLDWVEVLRTNVLGLAVAALASRDHEMRSLAGFVLSGTMAYLKKVAFQEKAQLEYILRLVRYAIPTPAAPRKSHPRLPVIISSFLAHALRALASPANPLYPTISRFLLQRPKFDIEDVPMLFGMLYASGEGHRRDRNWIVRFIKDSTRSEADWRLLKRRKTVELIQTLYSVSLDVNFRRSVLQAFERITRLSPAVLSLVHRNHLITWLEAQWTWSQARPSRAAEEERGMYLRILDNLVFGLVQREVHKEQKRAESGSEEQRDWSAKGREWTRNVESLIKVALPTADASRLDMMAGTLLRLGQMPSPCSVPPLLPALTARLVELFPEPSQDSLYAEIVEKLFETSLVLPCRGEGKLASAAEEIGWRARLLDTEVGDWVRKEIRLAAWEGVN